MIREQIPFTISGMGEYSNYQQKLIERYYDHRDEILLARLEEIVTELYLSESQAKTKRLWSRAHKAMDGLKVPAELIESIMKKADPQVLARHVREWLNAAKRNRMKR